MRGRKWMVQGVVCVLALFGVAGGAFGQASKKNSDKPVAVVNDEVITMAELDAVMQKEGPMPTPLPEAERKQHRQLVLDALINEVLIRQFLRKNVQPIEEREVKAHMADLVAQLRQQGKSLADFCRDMNKTEAQIKADLVAQLQWILYGRQHVSDQDVEKFYAENKDMFDKVLVRASEIMLRVLPQASESEKAQARAQLTEIRNKILANQIDFAEAAKQYSQGTTKDVGGDLDWFPHIRLKGMMLLPESLLETAFALQPGQVSEVIESEAGLHLIKVTDRKPGQPSDFNKIKQDVRQLCIEEMQQTILAQLRKTAKVQINLP